MGYKYFKETNNCKSFCTPLYSCLLGCLAVVGLPSPPPRPCALESLLCFYLLFTFSSSFSRSPLPRRKLERNLFNCSCEIRWIQLWQEKGEARLQEQDLRCMTLEASHISLQEMNISQCGKGTPNHTSVLEPRLARCVQMLPSRIPCTGQH